MPWRHDIIIVLTAALQFLWMLDTGVCAFALARVANGHGLLEGSVELSATGRVCARELSPHFRGVSLGRRSACGDSTGLLPHVRYVPTRAMVC